MLPNFQRLLRSAAGPLRSRSQQTVKVRQSLLEVTVKGAKKEDDAAKVARTIIESPLVKTAVYGEDPNWGRVVAAAGRCGC